MADAGGAAVGTDQPVERPEDPKGKTPADYVMAVVLVVEAVYIADFLTHGALSRVASPYWWKARQTAHDLVVDIEHRWAHRHDGRYVVWEAIETTMDAAEQEQTG